MIAPDASMLDEAARHAAACAGRVRLPLRNRVWRGSAGEMAGSGTGSSLDFQDHRAYLPGDDPRHINWAAYARTGQYSMKLYREEVRPTVDILFDLSASMFLNEAKASRSCELLYFALESARREGANPAVYFFEGMACHPVGLEDLDMGRWLDSHSPQPGKADHPPKAPSFMAARLRPGSFRVWISDLLFAVEPGPVYKDLLRGHGTGVILAPFAEEEARPDWSGVCDFNDVESGRVEARDVDAGLRRRYMQAYEAHFTAWKEAATRHHLPLARIPSAIDMDAAFASEALKLGALEPVG